VAWLGLYDNYRPVLVLDVLLRTLAPADREYVVQRVFIKAWSHLHAFQPRSDLALQQWLRSFIAPELQIWKEGSGHARGVPAELVEFAPEFLRGLLVAKITSRPDKAAPRIDKPWLPAGTRPNQYDMGVDPGSCLGRMNLGCILSNCEQMDGCGMLMQFCDPAAFIGRRVEFSAHLRAEGVAGSAGLLAWVDGRGRNKSLRFNYEHGGFVRGTSDWTRHSVARSIPEASKYIGFGVVLEGRGRVWIVDARLEVVGPEVPSTNMR